MHRFLRNSIAPLLTAALLVASPASAACGAPHDDIVDTAVTAGQFDTLVAAVEAAGLVDALKGDGPLTVFAPTDEAFAKLPPGTVESLLKPENKDELVAILTYHVAPGRLTADRVVSMKRIDTLNGQQPRVAVRGDTVMLDGATIVQTDIAASNGVIHVIDSVILPGDEPSRASAAARDVIHTAIARGVPLFNNRQPNACAAIYEVAAMSLTAADFGLSEHARDRLRLALDRMEVTHEASRRAWILRHALDDVLDEMEAMPSATPAMSLR